MESLENQHCHVIREKHYERQKNKRVDKRQAAIRLIFFHAPYIIGISKYKMAIEFMFHLAIQWLSALQ